MKKFILDRETNELIPWSEFVHEKEQVASQSTDNQELKEEEIDKDKSIEQEGERQIVEADNPTDTDKDNKGEAVSQVNDTEKQRTEDKVVLGSGQLGPPGEKKEVLPKKSNRKRKFKGPKLKIKESDIVDSPPIKKREWISL